MKAFRFKHDCPQEHLDALYMAPLAAPMVDTETSRGMTTSPAFPSTASPKVCKKLQEKVTKVSNVGFQLARATAAPLYTIIATVAMAIIASSQTTTTTFPSLQEKTP